MRALLTTGLASALMLATTACQQTAVTDMETSHPSEVEKDVPFLSDKERDIVDQMKWVRDADPVMDAQRALKSQKRPTLIAFSQRATQFPGLTPAQYDLLKGRVDVNYVKGAGDVIYGPSHKALLNQLRDYATQYNQTIFNSLR